MDNDAAGSKVRIRRYPNRRFYDRSRRQYVTLQDIEGHVLAGRTVEVLDSKSGEDLTRQVLTQILAEWHPRKMEMFPVAMLHDIIRANDVALELWWGYLRQALTAIEAWRAATIPSALPPDGTSPLLSRLAPGPPAPDLSGPRIEDLSERIRRLEAAAGRDPAAPPAPATLDELEERLQQLEDSAARGKGRKAPRNGRS